MRQNPARPDLWGARVSNDPGLPDPVTAWPLSGGFAGLRAVVPSAHLDFWIHHNERSFSVP